MFDVISGLLGVSRLFQNQPCVGTASAAIQTKDVVNQELQGRLDWLIWLIFNPVPRNSGYMYY